MVHRRRWLIFVVVALLVSRLWSEQSGSRVAQSAAGRAQWQYARVIDAEFSYGAQETFFSGGAHEDIFYAIPDSVAGKDRDQAGPKLAQAVGARVARMGQDGWDLVSVTSEPATVQNVSVAVLTYIFKRPL